MQRSGDFRIINEENTPELIQNFTSDDLNFLDVINYFKYSIFNKLIYSFQELILILIFLSLYRWLINIIF